MQIDLLESSIRVGRGGPPVKSPPRRWTIVKEPWHEVDPERDLVTVDGRRVHAETEKHYFKLYKPRGVTSTLQDRHAQRTLAEFIPPGLGLFPIGRLDRGSEGLMILTDDGELALKLSHPRYRVPKRYRVELARPLAARDLERLKQGLLLEDGPFCPSELRPVDKRTVELSLQEGRKREIRRGFAALGYRVVRLVQLAIGPVSLGGLGPGERRPLSVTELESLHCEGWLAELPATYNIARGNDARRGGPRKAGGGAGRVLGDHGQRHPQCGDR